MNGGDGGEGQRLEPAERPVAAGDQRQQLVRRPLGQLGEVDTRGEAVGFAGEDDQAGERLTLEPRELALEPLQKAVREGVDLVRGIVEPQPGDTALDAQVAGVGWVAGIAGRDAGGHATPAMAACGRSHAAPS